MGRGPCVIFHCLQLTVMAVQLIIIRTCRVIIITVAKMPRPVVQEIRSDHHRWSSIRKFKILSEEMDSTGFLSQNGIRRIGLVQTHAIVDGICQYPSFLVLYDDDDDGLIIMITMMRMMMIIIDEDFYHKMESDGLDQCRPTPSSMGYASTPLVIMMVTCIFYQNLSYHSFGGGLYISWGGPALLKQCVSVVWESVVVWSCDGCCRLITVAII